MDSIGTLAPEPTVPVWKVPARDVLWVNTATLDVVFVHAEAHVLVVARGHVLAIDDGIGPGWLRAGDVHINSGRIHCVEHRTSHGGVGKHTMIKPTTRNPGGVCPCVDRSNSVLEEHNNMRCCVYMDQAPAMYHLDEPTNDEDSAEPPANLAESAQQNVNLQGSFHVLNPTFAGPTVDYGEGLPECGCPERMQKTQKELEYMIYKAACS